MDRGEPVLSLNGVESPCETEGGFLLLRREWNDDTVTLSLPKNLRTWPLPDRPDEAAFLDGPVALAGLCGEARTLYGDPAKPEDFFTPDSERKWNAWRPFWRTVNQPVNIRFAPLYAIGYEPYTVYFPIKGG